MGDLLHGLLQVCSIANLTWCTVGVISGILVGALPGLTATMAVALLVPFTFGRPIIESMAMLLGIYCGAMYGGSISAILIRTPGTPSGAATVLDGYPLAKQGKAGKAIRMATVASGIGGLGGALIMTFLSPVISRAALAFSAPEYFSLAVFGLSIIISVSGSSITKGLIAGVFGLLLSTIGLDPSSGYPRFTFGSMELYGGLAFIPTLIGLFAISEVFINVEDLLTREKTKSKVTDMKLHWSELRGTLKTIFRSTILGTFIGAIPGAGADIAAFVGYSEAKRGSKHPELFGTGLLEGVAAAEAANNACTGGAMIPMLSLGVPGDAVTAVLLGALIIQGLQPGPMLFKEHLDLVNAIFAAMIVANIIMIILGLLGSQYVARIINIDQRILLSVILLLSVVGAFSMRNSIFDIWVALAFGVIGYFMSKYEFPTSPILLALILGPMTESNLRRALIMTHGDWTVFFTRPISLAMLCLAVISVVTSIRKEQQARVIANDDNITS
ncbi:MAG TPA: C4-dicarboxylate ABC transporter permease [Clostridiaceae bacterium]|nr:C4-dicarboxylate ABC transporter permease [Clostridiaceae bacterium]